MKVKVWTAALMAMVLALGLGLLVSDLFAGEAAAPSAPAEPAPPAPGGAPDAVAPAAPAAGEPAPAAPAGEDVFIEGAPGADRIGW